MVDIAAFRGLRHESGAVGQRRPALYVYERRHGTTSLKGLLAAVAVEPLGGAVLAHEQVEEDRIEAWRAQLEAVPAEHSPVFALAVAPTPALASLPETPDEPVLERADGWGTHRLWAFTDPALHTAVGVALAPVRVMIADGHHRYAAALRARRPRTLAYVVDPFAHPPSLGAIHRLLHDPPADLEDRLATAFELRAGPRDVERLAARVAAAPAPSFGIVLSDGTTRVLHVPRAEPGADVEILHDTVLPRAGGGEVGYRTDVAGAAREAAGALFVLRPPDLSTVLARALAGTPLPPKTTAFEPKPWPRLVLREERTRR